LPKSAFTEAYGTVLRTMTQARIDAGLTQAELSHRLGKTQPFMSKVESGVRRIDVIEFYAITKAMGHDPKQLFSSLADDLPDHVVI